MSDKRALALALVLLVAIAVPVAVLSTTDSDGAAKSRNDLLLERYVDPATLKPEIVAYLPEHCMSKKATVPDGVVELTCFDRAGHAVVTTREKWPLTTDLGGTLPHAHRPIAQKILDSIRRCSLTGGDLSISGTKFRR